jgi:hypothetical protein
MQTTRPVAILTIAALLTACATTLDVRGDNAQRPYAKGVVQVLPFTQYEVTASWRLVSCDKEYDNLALTVTAVGGARDDPAQRYLIDATSLQKALTKSEFGVSYFEGSNTLKAVNADVEDRTVEFATNVVTTIGKVASTFLPPLGLDQVRGDLPPAPPPPPPPPPPPIFCDPAARATLIRVARLKDALDLANERVEASTQEVARLIAVAEFGPEADAAAAKRFAAALEQQDKLRTNQANLTRQLEAALKVITESVTIRWPDSGSEFDRAEPLAVPSRALSRWFASGPGPGSWPQSYLAIRPSAGKIPTVASTPQPGRVAGIPYRINVQGRLVSCPDTCNRIVEADHKTLVEGAVAQLGGVKVLPVRNAALASSAFSAEFNRDATLVSAGFKQRAAPLEAASGIVAGASEKLAPLFDRTEKLKRETAHLEALKEHREAVKAAQPAAPDPSGAAAAALEADTTLLNAQISNLNAQITRDELLARIIARDEARSREP